MQQLNSPYRGDQSDSLSNIMGMQYAPQAHLNKFTGDMAMTGMSLANSTNRTAMQLASSEMMDRNRLREQARATNLNYLINNRNADLSEGRLGMDMAGQKFGQQKDVATFEQTRARDDSTRAYQSGDLSLKTLLANNARIEAEAARNKTAADAAAKGLADWSVWDEEATSVGDLLERRLAFLESDFKAGPKNASAAEADRLKALETAIKRIKYSTIPRFGGRIKWARDRYKEQGASFLPSFFASNLGNIKSIRQMAELEPSEGPQGAPASGLPSY